MMKQAASLIGFAAVLTLSSQAHAANGFALTPQAQSMGFTLTQIITNIPTAVYGQSVAGAFGVLATEDGNILVSSYNDDTVRLYTDSNGAKGSKLLKTTTVSGARYTQFAKLNGKIYAVNRVANTIMQLTQNGSFAGNITVSLPPVNFAIVAAPALNSLIVSTAGGLYLTTGLANGYKYSGLSAAPSVTLLSGSQNTTTLYFDSAKMQYYQENLDTFNNYTLSGKTVTHNSSTFIEGNGYGGSAYGIAKITGNNAMSGLFVLNNSHPNSIGGNSNSGDLSVINPTTNARVTIATNGEVGGRVAPDPDGSLLITQGDSVYKLRCGHDCAFN